MITSGCDTQIKHISDTKHIKCQLYQLLNKHLKKQKQFKNCTVRKQVAMLAISGFCGIQQATYGMFQIRWIKLGTRFIYRDRKNALHINNL